MARGRVTFYREEKGWGGISCDELPAGQDAWVHFSVIDAPGYRTLQAGEEVDFEYEPAVQDSWRFRATRVRSLRMDQPAPVDPPGPSPVDVARRLRARTPSNVNEPRCSPSRRTKHLR